MKHLILLFTMSPFFTLSQTMVKLGVTQPPEFGFEITKQDTTIVKGDTITLGNDIVVFGGSGEYIFSWSSGETLSDSTILKPGAFPKDSTTYFLAVQDSYGCSFTLSYTVNVQIKPTIVPVGKNMDNDLTAKLFPNPNNGKFKVQLTGKPRKKIDLLITDNSGRDMKKQTIRNFSGECTETLQVTLPVGMYTLLISSENQKLQRKFLIR